MHLLLASQWDGVLDDIIWNLWQRGRWGFHSNKYVIYIDWDQYIALRHHLGLLILQWERRGKSVFSNALIA